MDCAKKSYFLNFSKMYLSVKIFLLVQNLPNNLAILEWLLDPNF